MITHRNKTSRKSLNKTKNKYLNIEINFKQKKSPQFLHMRTTTNSEKMITHRNKISRKSLNKTKNKIYYNSEELERIQNLDCTPIVGTDPEKLRQYFDNKRGHGLDVFNVLVRFSKNYELVCPSHETIAKEIGCSIRTVLRWIKIFEHDGMLIVVRENRQWRTCLYKISSAFKNNAIRLALFLLIPIFACFPLEMLSSHPLNKESQVVYQKSANSFMRSEHDNEKMSYYKNENYLRFNLIYLRELLVSRNKLRFVTILRRGGFENYIKFLKINKVKESKQDNLVRDYPGQVLHKRKTMKMKETTVIPTYVKSIKHLDLTIAGMVYLSGFSERVIAKADTAIGRKRNVTDGVYNYFWGICSKIAKQKEEDIKWDVIDWLKEECECTDEDPRTNQDKIINQEPFQTQTHKKDPEQGHYVSDAIYSRPYQYGNKISFPITWSQDMKIEFMQENWPSLKDSPFKNDPRNPSSFKEQPISADQRCIFSEYKVYDTEFTSPTGVIKQKTIGFTYPFNPFGSNLLTAIEENRFSHEKLLEIKSFLEGKIDSIPNIEFFNQNYSKSTILNSIGQEMQASVGATPSYTQLLDVVNEQIKHNNIDAPSQSTIF